MILSKICAAIVICVTIGLFTGPATAAESKGSLEALGTRSGPFCEEFDRARSKHVRILCLGNVAVRWKFTTLMGEPVLSAIARWSGMVDSILLQTNTGFSTATASAKVLAAFAGVGPIDMKLRTDVEVTPDKPCAMFDRACKQKQSDKWWRCTHGRNRDTPACKLHVYMAYLKAHLILDPGALGKKGKWSFNTPASPSWTKLFNEQFGGGDGHHKLGQGCDSQFADQNYGAPKFVPADVAKRVAKRGFTLKKLGGCKIRFGGLAALNRALEETCEGYTGDDYKRRKCLEKKKKPVAAAPKKKPSGEDDEFARQIARADKTPKPGKRATKPSGKPGKDDLGSAISGIEVARRNEIRKREAIERARREAGKQRRQAERRQRRTRANQQALVDWRKKQLQKCAAGRPYQPISFTLKRRGGCDRACKARGREARRRRNAAFQKRINRWGAKRDRCRAKVNAEYKRRMAGG